MAVSTLPRGDNLPAPQRLTARFSKTMSSPQFLSAATDSSPGSHRVLKTQVRSRHRHPDELQGLLCGFRAMASYSVGQVCEVASRLTHLSHCVPSPPPHPSPPRCSLSLGAPYRSRLSQSHVCYQQVHPCLCIPKHINLTSISRLLSPSCPFSKFLV